MLVQLYTVWFVFGSSCRKSGCNSAQGLPSLFDSRSHNKYCPRALFETGFKFLGSLQHGKQAAKNLWFFLDYGIVVKNEEAHFRNNFGFCLLEFWGHFRHQKAKEAGKGLILRSRSLSVHKPKI